MPCPYCDHSNRPAAHCCAHCGQPLPLAWLQGPTQRYLATGLLTIGCVVSCGLQLTGRDLQDCHARLDVIAGRYVVLTALSLGHTRVAGRRSQRNLLANGAALTLGQIPLTFYGNAPRCSTPQSSLKAPFPGPRPPLAGRPF